MPFAVWTLCASMVTAPALAADVAMERLAPESSVFIMAASNVERTMNNFKQTPLFDMLMADELREQREEMQERFTEGLEQFVSELGIEKDDVQMPTGPGGFALYLARDEEFNTPYLAMIAALDYGEHADGTFEIIRKGLEQAEEDDPDFEYDVDELNGHPMFTIMLPKTEEDNAQDQMGFGPQMPDMKTLFGQTESMHIVRCDDVFLAGSDREGLVRAIETLDGDGAGNMLAERDDFISMRDMLGSSNDMYGAVLTRNLGSVVTMLDSGGMAGMFMPTVRAITGDIAGLGFSTRLNGPTAMTEMTSVVYMPNGKSGIPSLFDLETGIGQPPAFVSSDAISYSRMNVRFGDVRDVVSGVIDATPFIKMQAPPEELDKFLDSISAICTPLGDSVHTVQLASRPLDAETMSSFVAIECTNTQSFEDAMSAMSGGMGMNGRDFLGHRIYAMDMPMGLPMGGGMGGQTPEMAVGIGGQMVMIGETRSVEAGLRAIGRDDAGGLTENESYQRAMALLNVDEAVAWGYTDVTTTLEAGVQQQIAGQRSMIEEFREFDPDYADELERELESQMGALEAMDWDFVRRYVGPAVWTLRSVDNGYVTRAYILGKATDD